MNVDDNYDYDDNNYDNDVAAIDHTHGAHTNTQYYVHSHTPTNPHSIIHPTHTVMQTLSSSPIRMHHTTPLHPKPRLLHQPTTPMSSKSMHTPMRNKSVLIPIINMHDCVLTGVCCQTWVLGTSATGAGTTTTAITTTAIATVIIAKAIVLYSLNHPCWYVIVLLK